MRTSTLFHVILDRTKGGRPFTVSGHFRRLMGTAFANAIFLIALAILPSPTIGAHPSLPTASDVVSLTKSVSHDIVVAGGPETLLSSDTDFVGTRRIFEAGTGGVWCTGAARYLMGVAHARGWQTRRLDIGREGSNSTHSVVLVKTRRGWLASDPYLGRVILDPYPLAVNKVRRGERPSAVSFGADRRTVYSRKALAESDGNLGWTAGRKTPRPTPCSEKATTVICRVQHDVHDYENRWPYAPETIFYAGLNGLAGTIDSGLATPFALTAPSADGKPQNEDHQLIDKPEDVVKLTNTPPLWAFS